MELLYGVLKKRHLIDALRPDCVILHEVAK
ncbi:MAG: hypothetical protein JWO93_195 [Micrococcaceae bacterium]|nr:hypothetical protein [Micrococcaceae bacterium]